MNKLNVIAIAFLFGGLVQADQLLDDFEQGKTQNYLGGSWYYFSDVKDGGKSEIVNAELLNNGSYSRFIPDTGGCNSEKCAKMEFVMDTACPKDQENMPSFVGIGTDLKKNGTAIDIQAATGIRFKARSSDTVEIFIELATTTIFDYGYYRMFFVVTPTWQEFQINFDDFDFHQPRWEISYDSLILRKAAKINWQILGYHKSSGDKFYNGSSFGEENLKTGILYLDDIYLVGITPCATAAKGYKIHNETAHSKILTSLTGRLIEIGNVSKRSSGIYVTQSINKKRLSIYNQNNSHN